jgi:aspartyl/asparaginyl beta-hydroxylase (cupin superfamily)
MYAVGADYLGGVLITRLPPGGMIAPHHDRGGWHAEYLNCKVYVPLWGDDCLNTCEGEELVMKPGEAWTFDNLKVHSVHNRSTTDRAVLIICMRVE